MDGSKQPIELIREEKLKKIQRLRDQNINPFPSTLKFKVISVAKTRNQKENSVVSVAGRVMSVRVHGGIRFLDIKDETGQIQAAIKNDVVSETNKILIPLIDAGDFIEVHGSLFTTTTGELTVNVTDMNLLSKAIRPLPDQHEGLSDKEVRFRKRYLDLLINPSTRPIFDTRHALTKGIRTFLDQKGLTEVETPILQPLYGGANAKPFTTYINALNTDSYLRIASELYLKRLVVGGIEGVYDIAKDFRNEGIDQTHFPEFTMLEAYIPYANYQVMMDTMEELVRFLAKDVLHTNTVTVHETSIDLSGEWKRIPMTDLIREYLSLDVIGADHDTLSTFARDNHIEFPPSMRTGELIFLIFDKLVSHKLLAPTWVIDYPAEVSPLAKQHPTKAGFTERFEFYIGGVELMDGWSEINDPIEQRNRFEQESFRNLGSGEEQQPLDEDFLEALEYGAPPFTGVGIGIDRLTMFFTNTWSIQEVILFPFKKIAGKTENVVAVDKNVNGLPTREEAHQLLEKYVQDPYQRLHAKMVASALDEYAKRTGEHENLWYITGLLHDLDYHLHPSEHPQKELGWFSEWGYPEQLIHAVAAHAHEKTGIEPQTKLAKMLTATDEVAGIMYAYAILRPEGFSNMKPSSFMKKVRDRSFAPNISRDDIAYALLQLEGKDTEHFELMISVFGNMPDLKN